MESAYDMVYFIGTCFRFLREFFINMERYADEGNICRSMYGSHGHRQGGFFMPIVMCHIVNF